jgi:hypothetical protein
MAACQPVKDELVSDFSYLRHPAVIGISIVRVVGALLILLDPFAGFLLTCFLDYIDAQILIRFCGINRNKYHLWDKNIDWFTYVVMLTYGSNFGFFLPLFLLLFLRFFGQFMFLKKQSVRYFIFFPNLFEAVFFWFVLFHPLNGSYQLPGEYKWSALVFLTAGKLLQEILLHHVWPSYLLPVLRNLLARRGIRYL